MLAGFPFSANVTLDRCQPCPYSAKGYIPIFAKKKLIYYFRYFLKPLIFGITVISSWPEPVTADANESLCLNRFTVYVLLF